MQKSCFYHCLIMLSLYVKFTTIIRTKIIGSLTVNLYPKSVRHLSKRQNCVCNASMYLETVFCTASMYLEIQILEYCSEYFQC